MNPGLGILIAGFSILFTLVMCFVQRFPEAFDEDYFTKDEDDDGCNY